MNMRPAIPILIADDDPDDCLMIREAFRECRLDTPLYFVHDGEMLLDYLRRTPPYQDAQQHPWPGLILLDLNMPRMDGREALQAIKQDPKLRSIPVVIFSTSSSADDILHSYQMGSNAFISKPSSFSNLVSVIRSLHHYWLEVVALPQHGLPT